MTSPPPPPLPPPEHRLLLATFHFTAVPDITAWEQRFNNATDWYRYSPNCWLLWTSGTPQSWFEYLKPHVASSASSSPISGRTSGFVGSLPQGAWVWIAKYVALRDPI